MADTAARIRPVSTSDAAKALGVRLYWLENNIRRGNLDPPEKVGQAFIWWPEDIERARRLLASMGVR
jgi:hypothetical protein